jgi:hypothetical protein
MKRLLLILVVFVVCGGTVTSSETIQDVLKRHVHFVRIVQSCEKRNWPAEDAECVGAALGLAKAYVEDHPEYFGPDVLKGEEK